MSNGTLDRSEALKRRTTQFALRVIRMNKALPRSEEGRVIGRQILRSGTSIGANYRAACRVRTPKEFASKIRIVAEEADETAYWIELLIEGGVVAKRRMDALLAEVNELLAIFAASLNTVQRRNRRSMAR